MATIVVDVQSGVTLAGLPGGEARRIVTPADIATFASLSPPGSWDRAVQAAHALFEAVFLRVLAMPPRDAEVLLVEELEAGPVLRNALHHALVNILRVRAVAAVPHAIAAAVSAGTWTALVVHVGELGTRITPVVEGFVVEPAVQALPFGAAAARRILAGRLATLLLGLVADEADAAPPAGNGGVAHAGRRPLRVSAAAAAASRRAAVQSARALEHAALHPVAAGVVLGRSVQPITSLRALSTDLCVDDGGEANSGLEAAVAAWAAQLLRSEDGMRVLRITPPSPPPQTKGEGGKTPSAPSLTIPVPRPVAVACGLLRPQPPLPVAPGGAGRQGQPEAAATAAAALSRRVHVCAAGGAAAAFGAVFAPLFDADGVEADGADDPAVWLASARSTHDAVPTSHKLPAAALLRVVAIGADALAKASLDRGVGEATAAALLASPLDARKALAASIVLSGDGVASLPGMAQRLIAEIRCIAQRGGRVFKPLQPLAAHLAVINTVAPSAVGWAGGGALAAALAKRLVVVASTKAGEAGAPLRLVSRRERDAYSGLAPSALAALGAAGVWSHRHSTASGDSPTFALIDPDSVARPVSKSAPAAAESAVAVGAALGLDADMSSGALLQPAESCHPDDSIAAPTNETLPIHALSAAPAQPAPPPLPVQPRTRAGENRADRGTVGVGRGVVAATPAPASGGTTREQWQSIGTRSKGRGGLGGAKKSGSGSK